MFAVVVKNAKFIHYGAMNRLPAVYCTIYDVYHLFLLHVALSSSFEFLSKLKNIHIVYQVVLV